MITPDALRLNFTNEGGVNGTTRLLKNVLGLWMLQGCRQSWTARGLSYDYRELIELATREPSFRQLVDPDDEHFLRPPDMLAAIDQFCGRTHQPVPKEPGSYVRAVLESLAFKYRLILRNLEQVSGKRIEADSHYRRRIQESPAEPTDCRRHRQNGPCRTSRGHRTWECSHPDSGDRRRGVAPGSPGNRGPIIPYRGFRARGNRQMGSARRTI